jgi:hypothetical protein
VTESNLSFHVRRGCPVAERFSAPPQQESKSGQKAAASDLKFWLYPFHRIKTRLFCIENERLETGKVSIKQGFVIERAI